MPVPTSKTEISGALVVAASLLLGGLLTYVCDRLDLPTPGLLIRRPSAVEVEMALRQAGTEDPGSTAAGVTGPAEKTSCADGHASSALGVDCPRPSILGARGGIQSDGGESSAGIRKRRLARIEINTATSEELQQLDGIGPALAGRIVEYRTRFGPFRKMEDLLDVRGIGPAKLASIRAVAGLGDAPPGSQKIFLTSTSSQPDSSSFHR